MLLIHISHPCYLLANYRFFVQIIGNHKSFFSFSSLLFPSSLSPSLPFPSAQSLLPDKSPLYSRRRHVRLPIYPNKQSVSELEQLSVYIDTLSPESMERRETPTRRQRIHPRSRQLDVVTGATGAFAYHDRFHGFRGRWIRDVDGGVAGGFTISGEVC